ncbi:ABC transporter ATP-binding protein [Oceanirhabdus sp. W0125-5]|uniref:ABC transporter ATP-binding protein n=1 Tax=Oceanirhabdus sp. W0125-5 TaxID=2999116 RepID=UPI0022F2F8FB|nr:ABC transporter ATP-binding protein [Oceanirhabdus sp. W0125-5]WBW98630.1 ABC transporter ATP-binding protein [Oceanirhabdus sp. W0125-5]
MSKLNCENITKIYGDKYDQVNTKALNGISFQVEEGEFIAIMGPSGSGKTTLLNLLSGIDKASSGKITINNKNISEMSKNELALFRREELGFVFQDYNLLDNLTLSENIIVPLVLEKKTPEEIDSRLIRVMELFGIYELSRKYPYNISGGEQQRIAIARAVINEPSIIFADEPTGNLDSKNSKNIMKCFSKMNEELNSTILMVTHDPIAASYAKKIIFIKDGKLHSEIINKGNRREFLNSIFNCLVVLGGEGYDF